eukprot:scaffold589087_cov50-Prasinocladus_malaysianus.AAC.1
MIGSLITLYEPIIATLMYLGTSYLFPRQATLIKTKLDFLTANDLGYLYVAWILVVLGRVYAGINVNAARGPARVDRPDQH